MKLHQYTILVRIESKAKVFLLCCVACKAPPWRELVLDGAGHLGAVVVETTLGGRGLACFWERERRPTRKNMLTQPCGLRALCDFVVGRGRVLYILGAL